MSPVNPIATLLRIAEAMGYTDHCLGKDKTTNPYDQFSEVVYSDAWLKGWNIRQKEITDAIQRANVSAEQENDTDAR